MIVRKYYLINYKNTTVKLVSLPVNGVFTSDSNYKFKVISNLFKMEPRFYPGNQKSINSKYPRKQSRTLSSIKVNSSIPIERHLVFKWYGWGYKDSGFVVRNGIAAFTGNRYIISGNKLPHAMKYIEKKLGIVVHGDINSEVLEIPKENEFTVSQMKSEEIEALVDLGITISTKGIDRLIRSCGQGLPIMALRNNSIERIPDAVAWPTCHEEVEKIVQLANKMNFIIIPFGGGTSVNNSLLCPTKETRSILSLDMGQMNEILSLSPENLTVTCEAGIIGQDLERELGKMGYTTGHDPDSIEFSTLGGWISTRASGMKQNQYGNIEDLFVQAKLITPRGVLNKKSFAPRVSCGPDLNHLILGSEGNFGVITEATIKIRPAPETVKYASIIFPDFDTGINFLRCVAFNKIQPASIRLLDEEQFQFGMALQIEKSAFKETLEKIKIFFVTHFNKFNPEFMCMATLLYEGNAIDVLNHEKKINEVAARYKGIPAGNTNGRQGYLMTHIIAYIRDMICEINIVYDTFETSVPWNKVKRLIGRLRMVIQKESLLLGVWKSIVMFRVAQSYDSGCCVYGYYNIPKPNNMDAHELSIGISSIIRREILAMGGSISHHHGVGKSRSKYFEDFISSTGADVLRAAKHHLDPNNVFGAGNLLPDFDKPNIKLESKL